MARANNYIFLLNIVVIFIIINLSFADDTPVNQRFARFNFPFFGSSRGIRCNGCPSHFCDDDPAVIHGYCCGCAGFFDSLPIKCRGNLECPPNLKGLCHDYEYMMQCCCN